MNGRERCMTVLNGGIPDRVPVSLHNFQMAIQRSGRPFSEVLRDGALLAECMVNEWREFGHDMILLEIGTACSAEALGAGVEYAADRAPSVVRPAIESLEQVESLRIPPIASRPSWQVTLEAVRLIRRELGDQVAICGRADQGPFSLASMLRGMETFMMDIAMGIFDEPIARLMSFCEEVVFEYARAMKEAGADTASIGESFAGPSLLSPADYRRLAWPHEKRLIERVQNELGLPFHLHICGFADPILEEMVGTGARVLELDQAADFALAKSVARGRTTLHGNIEPARCLFGTPEEVSELTRRAIDAAGAGGGLLVGPGCALAGPTPPENIHALVRTAREYGVYSAERGVRSAE